MTKRPDKLGERTKTELTFESTFEALQNPRRRWTLRYLSDHSQPVNVSDLADQITAWEQGSTTSEIAPDARKSVYNSLCQTHLPQLERHGIVEYDHESGQVGLAPNATQLERYMPLEPAIDDRWITRILAVAGLGGLAVIANWTGPLAGTIPPQTLNIALVALFLLVSVLYVASSRRGAAV